MVTTAYLDVGKIIVPDTADGCIVISDIVLLQSKIKTRPDLEEITSYHVTISKW